MLHERGGRNNRATASLIGWIIGQIPRHQKIYRSHQRDSQERFIIRVRQIQMVPRCFRWVKGWRLGKVVAHVT